MSEAEVRLRWGPCDGDTVGLDTSSDREIRIPCVLGVCLDELPANLGKDLYTEAIYLPDSKGDWYYAGRMRYAKDGTAYWSPG
jgi:hypothetical protein